MYTGEEVETVHSTLRSRIVESRVTGRSEFMEENLAELRKKAGPVQRGRNRGRFCTVCRLL